MMSILKIDGHEAAVLKLASEIRDSFYDASYAHFADVMNVPLVTSDERLSKRIGGRIPVRRVSDI
jgi:predicted nucleic acid-binding protein